MNTNKLKDYAPKARQDFINAVSRQAARYGITEDHIDSIEEKGDAK